MIREAQKTVTSHVINTYAHAVRHKLRIDEMRRIFVIEAALARHIVKFRWRKKREAAKLVHNLLTTTNILIDMKKAFKEPKIFGMIKLVDS